MSALVGYQEGPVIKVWEVKEVDNNINHHHYINYNHYDNNHNHCACHDYRGYHNHCGYDDCPCDKVPGRYMEFLQ